MSMCGDNFARSGCAELEPVKVGRKALHRSVNDGVAAHPGTASKRIGSLLYNKLLQICCTASSCQEIGTPWHICMLCSHGGAFEGCFYWVHAWWGLQHLLSAAQRFARLLLLLPAAFLTLSAGARAPIWTSSVIPCGRRPSTIAKPQPCRPRRADQARDQDPAPPVRRADRQSLCPNPAGHTAQMKREINFLQNLCGGPNVSRGALVLPRGRADQAQNQHPAEPVRRAKRHLRIP